MHGRPFEVSWAQEDTAEALKAAYHSQVLGRWDCYQGPVR